MATTAMSRSPSYIQQIQINRTQSTGTSTREGNTSITSHSMTTEMNKLQHEIDHLNGIVFTGRAKPLALQNGLKKRIKHFKRFARSVVESSLKRSV